MSNNMIPMKNSSKIQYKDVDNVSLFHLTFAFEVLNIDVWHDCEEGAVDLGPVSNGLRLHYTLCPGQSFELDVLVWPHVVKIGYGNRQNWVRTFQYLQKRWFAFSIKHAIPVKVNDLINFVATVNVSFGTGAASMAAKGDRPGGEVYIPPLQFGEKRYFGRVIENMESTIAFIKQLIWKTIVDYIPATCMDTVFDTPTPVTDIRHQDTLMYKIQDMILNKVVPELSNTTYEAKFEPSKRKMHTPSKTSSKVKRVIDATKGKLEIKLSGNAILSGTGRVTLFEVEGESPSNSDFGDVIVMLGTCNLPSHDDIPITFLNVDNLLNIPVKEFKKHRISHLYLQWHVRDEIFKSEQVPWNETKEVKFNYHQTVPLPCNIVSEYVAQFLDKPFSIELRGVRPPKDTFETDTFFGYDKNDKIFSKYKPPEPKVETLDFLIATTKIDARTFSKGTNKFMQGNYTMYPIQPKVEKYQRKEVMCTNDINAVRAKVVPEIIVQTSAILESQMSLEASFGFVGCKPQRLKLCYSRLYCKIRNSKLIINVMKRVSEINEEIFIINNSREEMLTGFALDTGDLVFVYVEGPRDGTILSIWEMLEEFHQEITPIFSSSARYVERLYQDFLEAPMPFNILKMHASLGVLLACPPVYVRPSLPLPTRAALLKIGRLLMHKMDKVITSAEMPTASELLSFRLELCAPPKPIRFLTDNFENLMHQLIPYGSSRQVMMNSMCDFDKAKNGLRASFTPDTKKEN